MALFDGSTTTSSIGINLNLATGNNGGPSSHIQLIGEILLGASNATSRTIGNSSTVAGGTLTINGVGGILIDNSSSSATGLTLTNAVASGTQTMKLAFGGSGTINVANSASTVTIASTIYEAVAGVRVTKTGAGLLDLADISNNISGGLSLNGGTVNVTGTGAVGPAPAALVADILSFNGGTMRFSGDFNSTATERGVTVNASGGTFDVINANTATFSGAVAGTGRVYKTGTGILQLRSSNTTYTGGLQIEGGTVQVRNVAGIGAVGGSFVADLLSLNGGTLAVFDSSISSTNANRGITLGSNSGTFDVASALTLTLGGKIAGGGRLYKTSAGTLILGTTSGSTYTGGMEINGGWVSIADNTALGAAPGSTTANQVTLNGGTLLLAGNINSSSANRGVTINASNGTFDVTSANTGTINGSITGAGRLYKAGTGTLYLNGASSNYQGGLEIMGGTVRISSNPQMGAAPVGSPVANSLVINGGTLLVDHSTAAGTTRGLTLNANGGTISVTTGNNWTWAGPVAGTGALNKSGPGALALSNSSIAYSGTTTVSAGTLLVNGTHSPAGGADNYQINSSATLGGSGTITLATGKAINVNSGGTVAPGNSAGLLTLNGDYTMANDVTSSIEMEVGGSPANGGTDFDVLQVNGTLTLAGARLNIIPTTGVQTGTEYYIIRATSYSAASNNKFGKLNDRVDSLFSGIFALTPSDVFRFSLRYDDSSANKGVYITFDAVPEPTSLSVIGMSAALLTRRVRRSRK